MIDTLDAYQLEIQNASKILSPRSFFTKAKALEIEIGCGKGHFLAETAREHPRNFYVGIESAHVYARIAEEKMSRRAIRNVRIVDWSAETLLPFLRPRSVSRFHIYFPDPWPKKRHHKRRLWKGDFIQLMDRLLAAKGKIYFATDHRHYFETVIGILKKKNSPFALEKKAAVRFFKDAGHQTGYEIKFAGQKRKLYYASFVKRKKNVRRRNEDK